MLGQLYIVRQGDTLWDISAKHLGTPLRWPEIYEHNNTPAVVAHTKIKIINPDLIFVNQIIYIPEATRSTNLSFQSPPKIPSAKPIPNAGKSKAKSKVRSIPFKYALDSVRPITVVSPLHVATISLKGSVTIQSKKTIDFVTLTKRGFEITAKQESDIIFGKLISETQLGFNSKTNEVTFECGITHQSNQPYSPKIKVAMGISSKTGLPVLKGGITAPDIHGKVDEHLYLANDLGIEVEITPRPPKAKPHLIPVPPSAKPVPEASSDWDYLLATSLVAGAAVIVVATIVEDIVTLGAGLADDVPSFAAASAMFASGMTIFSKVNSGKPIKIEGSGVAPDQI